MLLWESPLPQTPEFHPSIHVPGVQSFASGLTVVSAVDPVVHIGCGEALRWSPERSSATRVEASDAPIGI
jgi:hypothetical protein